MLANMTIAELKTIAERMGLSVPSKLRKAEIVAFLTERIDGWHVIALDMNKAMAVEAEATYAISGTDTVLRGDTARIMIYHMTNVHRFNPSESRDSDGRIRLTPKQVKRCAKKLRRFMKRENLWETKVA